MTLWNDHLNDVVDGLLAMALWAWVRAWARHRPRLAYHAARAARAACNENAQWCTYNVQRVARHRRLRVRARPLGHHRHEGVAPSHRVELGSRSCGSGRWCARRESDAMAACTADVPFIGYANKPGKEPRLRDAGAQHVVTDLYPLALAMAGTR